MSNEEKPEIPDTHVSSWVDEVNASDEAPQEPSKKPTVQVKADTKTKTETPAAAPTPVKSVVDFNYEEVAQWDDRTVKDMKSEELIKVIIRRGKTDKNPVLWKGGEGLLKQINGEPFRLGRDARDGSGGIPHGGHGRYGRPSRRRGRGRGDDKPELIDDESQTEETQKATDDVSQKPRRRGRPRPRRRGPRRGPRDDESGEQSVATAESKTEATPESKTEATPESKPAAKEETSPVEA